MRERVRSALAGFFAGGFLGWFMGFAWYEFIEVPKAASMNSVAAENYLCAAASLLPLLAFPGAILGAIIGARRIISNEQ
jgi:hypothetical protein